MKKRKIATILLAACLLLGNVSVANAASIDNGNKVHFNTEDNDTDLTLLQSKIATEEVTCDFTDATMMEQVHMQIQEGCDDKMGHYVHYIGGGIVDSKIYETGNAAKSFKSPMKELNEQTVLIENAKTNKNDSYHQHTKYDDQVDRYYSTYDIGTLLHNNESYLEGTIDSKYDVDYYSFSYPQKSFYSKMGISSEITISLESKNSQAYNLVLYDLYGNQIGIATDDGHGNKQLTVPNWDCVTSDYVIRVENSNMTSDSGEGSYRIKITETKNRDTSSSNVQHSQEIANADNSEEKMQ